ncbi:Predicted nucleic acid-binding protein, contains PIN domain [Mesorhizobium albiziae]|uniref:Ribonuclease VapC n=1 Tax=Neomesorhizobium albiziae TaxID=335020 RepID=A0A1I3XGP7_9HYPH|nr:PIN domain-containing protein [Mesorhizobium albiziae]GLS30498.1 ribonuclease VapC [Mesorhizobium albiziae]SFK18251.1 Predicted nucleic acid-binding protein, contains PIN domain [Mesorhizobium albiziae]
MPAEPQAREFLDTNILIYAFSTDPRAAPAEALLAKGCVTSVQALNEFANVARRKLAMPWLEVNEALAAIRTLCRAIVPLDLETHAEAMVIAERDGLAVFDALMLAAALRAGCGVFWSEDMQHCREIGGRLRIVNPFVAE